MCFVPNSLKVFAVHYFLLPSSYFHPVFMTNDAGIPKLRTKYFVLEHESTHLRVGIVCNGSVHLNSDQNSIFFHTIQKHLFLFHPFTIPHTTPQHSYTLYDCVPMESWAISSYNATDLPRCVSIFPRFYF